jgi:ABC-type nitrate/sulfonate/bicarbonate transport system substrate-binding protein
MNRFQQRLTLIGIVVFSTCFGAVHESAGQSSTLTAFYTAPVASMSPMWIAKEAGFFKKQGLDVKLVFIASGPTGTTSLLAGETDVGIIGGFARRGQVAAPRSDDRPKQTCMTGTLSARKRSPALRSANRLGIDRIV